MAPTVEPCENTPPLEGEGPQISAPGRSSAASVLFSEAVRLYEHGYLSRKSQIAKPTREKESYFLTAYIVPRWGNTRLTEMYPQAIEEWLHATFRSWWTMHGVRGIMGRVFHYADGHGFGEGVKGNPAAKAKLGKKRYKHERCILSLEETARVLARLEEPNRLILETCVASGARISEILGLKWKCINLDAATIRIEQRLWRQDLDRPKTEGSRRTLGIGILVERYREKALRDASSTEAFVFQQRRNPGKPLWDSGVRDALHQAAKLEGCDFPGLGPHSFRRANITWRQQVGGSAIEASKIAGHSSLKMTGEYTFVDPVRQNELTLRIQQRLADASALGSSITAIRFDTIPSSHSMEDKSNLTPADKTATPALTLPIPNEQRRSKVTVRPDSKSEAILALLERPEGATRNEIMAVTGWKAHSVRGFISGVAIKRMGCRVESSARLNGDRHYRISSPR